MKLYTKTGDAGETSLYGGTRLSKADARIAAYGSVDELQASLGVAAAHVQEEDPILGILLQIQRDTFIACCELARKEKIQASEPELSSQQVAWLETQIDTIDASLPKLRSFIVQGGCLAGAHLHLSRTICRRAEREIVALSKNEPVNAVLIQYVNRLSDLLFVLARKANLDQGKQEQAVQI